jgi:hypothetical protein
MLRRLLGAVALAVWACLFTATTALAGGWAVTAFDPLPETFQAGQSYRLGYTILQHGITPFRADSTTVRIIAPGGGESHTFTARPEGPAGHYVVDVTFPAAGEWQWEVKPGLFETQRLGTVRVLPAGTTPSTPSNTALAPNPSTTSSPAALPTAPHPAIGILRFLLPLATAAAAGWFAAQLASDHRARRAAAVPVPLTPTRVDVRA